MKVRPSAIISTAAILGLAGIIAAILIVGRYSVSRHLTKRFQEVARPTFQAGDDVFLRPGRIPAVIINYDTNAVDVCVRDLSGGVKMQTVSPLVLEPKTRW